MDELEQTLTFSDRRATIAVVAGLVALALIGVAGGALVKDSCSELFTVGERRTFVRGNPEEVLTTDPDAANALLTYGRGAGIGDWRGSVALGPDASVDAAQDGFVVFTATGIDALEPGLMAVNASRGTQGLRGLPAFNGAAIAAVGPAPFEIAVLDEDLALIGCGRITREGAIVDVDRVRALFVDGTTLTASGLDGDDDWVRTFDHPVVSAHLLLGAVLVVTRGDVVLIDVGDGATFQRWPLDGAELLALDASAALVETSRRTVLLRLADGRSSDVDLDPSAGVVLIGDRVVAGADLPTLPGGLEVRDIVATEGGYVGLEVDVDGQRRLLLYGPAERAG